MPSSDTLRDASTMILIRPANGRIETYLLRRSTKSGFMDGLYVFPGGTVDDSDREYDFWKNSIDLSIPLVEDRFCTPDFTIADALSFGIAAIRETLEEAGILLASQTDKSPADFKQMADLRLNQDLSDDWFRKNMEEENWKLLFSALGCWSHWITPEKMKKRFDTRFYIALMPEDQTCVPDDVETKHGIWINPQKALEQNLAGGTPLSPPTIVTLTQLLEYDSMDKIETAILNKDWGAPMFPFMIKSDKGPVIIEPWDLEFSTPEQINLDDIDQKTTGPGEVFSRIWCDKGIWRPASV